MKLAFVCGFFALCMVSNAQEIKNGAIIFDFGKKKQTNPDSTQQSPPVKKTEKDSTNNQKQKKQEAVRPKVAAPYKPNDYKQGGIFKALFHAGINACQIDGDNEYGYTYFGAEAGIGALARFHRLLSVSMELNYSMEGARAHYESNPQNPDRYKVEWDYMQVPVSLNGHYKDLFILSVGLAPGYMVRYKEFNSEGLDVTGNTSYVQIPRRFDLEAFGALHFIIKKHYAIGGKFSYSTVKIRDAFSGTRVNGQYNNLVTLRFMYLLDTVKRRR